MLLVSTFTNTPTSTILPLGSRHALVLTIAFALCIFPLVLATDEPIPEDALVHPLDPAPADSTSDGATALVRAQRSGWRKVQDAREGVGKKKPTTSPEARTSNMQPSPTVFPGEGTFRKLAKRNFLTRQEENASKELAGVEKAGWRKIAKAEGWHRKAADVQAEKSKKHGKVTKQMQAKEHKGKSEQSVIRGLSPMPILPAQASHLHEAKKASQDKNPGMNQLMSFVVKEVQVHKGGAETSDSKGVTSMKSQGKGMGPIRMAPMVEPEVVPTKGGSSVNMPGASVLIPAFYVVFVLGSMCLIFQWLVQITWDSNITPQDEDAVGLPAHVKCERAPRPGPRGGASKITS